MPLLPPQTTTAGWPTRLLDRPSLTELWGQPDDVLGPIVARSAMSHTGVPRVRRNLAVALGNSGSAEAATALREPKIGPSNLDPLVSEHVAWAETRLSTRRHGRVRGRFLTRIADE